MPAGSEPGPRTDDGSPPIYTDDVALVHRAIAGVAGAAESLAQRMACLGRIAAGLNLRMGHGLDADELADVVQSVATAVWSHLPAYRGTAPLEAWAFSFCDHELRNAARRMRRRHRALLPLDTEPFAKLPTDDTLADELQDCLSRLGAWDQDAIHARHFEGLNLAELAARFACKINTLKSRYYRSLQLLRECLEGKVAP